MRRGPLRNLGIDLVRATEAAALQAGRWMGLGLQADAQGEASNAMFVELNGLSMRGTVVCGEDPQRNPDRPLCSGRAIGTGEGPTVDVAADALDGRRLLARGENGAIAVAAVAPQGCIWSPEPARYMEKLVVDDEVAAALVPECLDAPAAWTLALIARVKHKAVRDLVVFMLDRPRHTDLIDEIRAAGARVTLRPDGDIAGALQAADRNSEVDLLLGIGGAREGVVAAAAVKSLGGAMLARLAPQSADEAARIAAAGLSTSHIMTCDELIAGNEIFFAVTGITDGSILRGVRYRGKRAETESMVLRCETRTRRLIRSQHLLEEG